MAENEDEVPFLIPLIIRVWIEGSVHLYAQDAEKKLAVDRARALLTPLGFRFHEQQVAEEAEPKRRRWSPRRVTAEDVIVALEHAGQAGLTILDLADGLFRTEPSNDQARAAAVRRASVSTLRLARDGRIRKAFDPDGTARFRDPAL